MRFSIVILLAIVTLSYSCKSDSSNNDSQVKMEDVFSEINSDLKNAPDQEEVTHVALNRGVVTEVLNTERYTYLNLENSPDKTFWIAIARQPIEVGEQIVFEEGILKQNFQSKEFNRMFETIYLVSRFQRFRKSGNNNTGTLTPATAQVVKESKTDSKKKTENRKNEDSPAGTTPLSDILNKPADYQGKEVSVYGLVIKVNYNIMGTNWVHLQDRNSKEYELTITTHEQVMEGEEVSFRGMILLDKDFGAGYRYDIIMEEAKRQ